MSAPHDEPVIPPRLRRPLAAVWISLGLHAAVIALLQVAPPAAVGVGAPAIEVRLVSQHEAPVPETLPEPVPTAEPQQAAALAPSVTAEPLPVAEPAATPSAPPAQPVAAAAQPAAAAPPAATPAAAITSAVDLTYYTARDLDVQPRALREIVPDYPYDADRQRLSGQVKVQLKLEADGRISDLEIASATPPGVFDESALKALRTARFAPAQKNGRPVRARVVITIEYDWEGRVRNP